MYYADFLTLQAKSNFSRRKFNI